MTLAITLASRQSTFTVFQAFQFLMPQPEREISPRWKTKAPFLAISVQIESTPVTKDELEKCIESSTYQIYHKKIAHR